MQSVQRALFTQDPANHQCDCSGACQCARDQYSDVCLEYGLQWIMALFQLRTRGFLCGQSKQLSPRQDPEAHNATGLPLTRPAAAVCTGDWRELEARQGQQLRPLAQRHWPRQQVGGAGRVWGSAGGGIP